ncbi:hypothetical protein V5799_013616 [Amblyomma americanum]|uniref:Uncharacterized protein n=1 Tax=Amblyomma americanum TaxID=6943 RepID=A0AAQ4E5D9_AMBAM
MMRPAALLAVLLLSCPLPSRTQDAGPTTTTTSSAPATTPTPQPSRDHKPADIKQNLIDWLLDSIDPHHETEFEGYDGWYNNPSHPELGSADGHLIRLFPAQYSDGSYRPNGQDRPNPFTVSEKTMRGNFGEDLSRTGKTAFLVFFGQQVVEEILDAQRSGCPPEYFNIPIPETHEYRNIGAAAMPFLRTRYDVRTGNSPNNPRRQINEITPWIDGGLTYGTSKTWADTLRAFAAASWPRRTAASSPWRTASDYPWPTRRRPGSTGYDPCRASSGWATRGAMRTPSC